ncbi:MAG: hypothetical protein JSS20_09960 [Proteobacteria bacterium]|nr:hypothetical protein [Pseudomonadota bacterium]
MPARLTDEARRDLAERGVYLRPSRYGDGPYPITQRLLDEGRRHAIGGTKFDPGRPVHVLHGADDPDVPLTHSHALLGELAGDWIRLTVVPDGDHRLSRPQDIELLLRTVEGTDGALALKSRKI